MQVTIVHVTVKMDHIDDFIEASRHNHEASVMEQGNRRFDVLQSADDPTRFVLYEAYESAAEAANHKETEHYKTMARNRCRLDGTASPGRSLQGFVSSLITHFTSIFHCSPATHRIWQWCIQPHRRVNRAVRSTRIDCDRCTFVPRF